MDHIFGRKVTAGADNKTTKTEIESAIDDVYSEEEVDAAEVGGKNVGEEERVTETTEDFENIQQKDTIGAKRKVKAEEYDDSDGAEDYAASDTTEEQYDNVEVETETGSVVPGSEETAPYLGEGQATPQTMPATATKKTKVTKATKDTKVKAEGDAGNLPKTNKDVLPETADSDSDDSKQQMVAMKRQLVHLSRQAAAIKRKIESQEEEDLDSEEDDYEEEESASVDPIVSQEDDIEDEVGEEEVEGQDDIEDEIEDMEEVAPEEPEDLGEEADLEEEEASARTNFAKAIKKGQPPVEARKRLVSGMKIIDAKRTRLAKKIMAKKRTK